MKRRSSFTSDVPDLDEEVWAFLEGELDEESNLRVEARIEADPLLAARVAEIRRADAMLRALPAPDLRPGARDDLWRRIRSEQRSNVHSFPPLFATVRRGRAGLWVSAAAAALLVWVAVGRIDQPLPDRTDEPLDDVSRIGAAEDPALVFVPPETLEGADPGMPSGIALRRIEDDRPQQIAATERQPQRADRPTEDLAHSGDVAATSNATQAVTAASDVAVNDDLPGDDRANGDLANDDLVGDQTSEPSEEEILLALELEVLRDLAVIENLELLEALGPLPGEEPG